MCNNLQHILDEGEIKYVPEVNMNKKTQEEIAYSDVLKKHRKNEWKKEWDPEKGHFREIEIRNEEYEPYPEKSVLNWFMEIRRPEIWDEHFEGGCPSSQFARRCRQHEAQVRSEWKEIWKNHKVEIYSYLGREVPIPFNPSVMINISPNWKGKFGQDKLTDKIMIKKFIIVVEKYLKASNRYSKYKWNLECGGEGNHLHAHIVAEIRPGSYKSVITHLNKGNHSNEIRKIWDQTFRGEGYQRVCKGKHSIQRILLRNEELLKDKLNYLVEENKPEGHKNLKDLNILMNEGF